MNEKNAKFYDEVFKDGGYKKMYFKHYSESPYIDIWYKALELMKQIRDTKIIDIGCGPGQFANLIFDNGIIKYQGIDFSEEAIQLACKTNENFAHLFKVDNAYNSDVFSTDYNLVVMLEVLEHLEKDLEILKKIKKGIKVLFSVPNYSSEAHLRVFNCEEDIQNRYNKIIEIDDIYTFNLSAKSIIFLVQGIKI